MARISGMSEKSMVSSPIVWRASISASCSGERGLPRSSCSENCFSIKFSFVTGCAAGGNDSHDLLRALFSVGVNHGEKQQRALHRAAGMPARFARFDPLRERQAIWVLKDQDGGSERNPVLADIGFVLLVVPFESHRFLLLQILASAKTRGPPNRQPARHSPHNVRRIRRLFSEFCKASGGYPKRSGFR